MRQTAGGGEHGIVHGRATQLELRQLRCSSQRRQILRLQPMAHPQVQHRQLRQSGELADRLTRDLLVDQRQVCQLRQLGQHRKAQVGHLRRVSQ